MRILAYLSCLICLSIFLPTLGNAECMNNYGCLSGYTCVKRQFELTGVCVKIGGENYENYERPSGGVGEAISEGIKYWQEDSRKQEQHEQQMRLMEEQRKLMEEQRRALEDGRQRRALEEERRQRLEEERPRLEATKVQEDMDCRDSCKRLYNAKQLKPGMSIKECIRRTCD